MTKNKEYLIREFTEFNFLRMNSDSVPQSTHTDNPSLSLGSYNRFQMNMASTVQNLNHLFKSINTTSRGVNLFKGSTIGMDSIKDIKILRIFERDDIYWDVYISFLIEDKEYYGVIKKINDKNVEFYSEAFKDPMLAISNEWIIRVKGNIIKTIKRWLNPSVGNNFVSLKEINAVDQKTGEIVLIQEDSKIKVVRTMDEEIFIQYEDSNYILKGKNYYFFNYYFERVKSEE